MEWRAFELHPEVPPEGMELPAYLRNNIEEMRRRLKQMANEVGLEMVVMDRMINSRRALEAAEYAREQGLHDPFHRLVFHKFYGEGQDMSDWTVLRAAAEEVGLNPEEMQRQVEAGRYRDPVDQQFAEARRRGVTGVPAYIFDDKYAVIGAQPYGVFQQVMARLEAEAGDGQAEN